MNGAHSFTEGMEYPDSNQENYIVVLRFNGFNPIVATEDNFIKTFSSYEDALRWVEFTEYWEDYAICKR